MIRLIEEDELAECLSVIHSSFETVARQFNLTKENCPKHTSFMPIERLEQQFDEKRLMYAYVENEKIIGYFSLCKNEDGSYELLNVAVLPENRHSGIGKEMVLFASDKVRELGSNKIKIGIIEENEKLKEWYSRIGFEHTGTRKFDHLPFTVGFMEMKICP